MLLPVEPSLGLEAGASGRHWRRSVFPPLRSLCRWRRPRLTGRGVGIVECEVIQWFVEPGARVEEFSPLCEVQSDKASVEITSRFAGTVKKLYYEAGEMAKVGRPFVDIDILDDDVSGPAPAPSTPVAEPSAAKEAVAVDAASTPPSRPPPDGTGAVQKPRGKMATLATPAVRFLSRTLDIDISQIDGSGRDGRVLKEDIHRFVQATRSAAGPSNPSPRSASPPPGVADSAAGGAAAQTESRVPLSPMQQQMFKTMSRSLAIPHFLYADEVDVSGLVRLRGRLNRLLTQSRPVEGQPSKLSYLPFIIKAVSMALYQYPLLNARVDLEGGYSGGKPTLMMRSQHNIGVAMDTPQGLVVPVIKDVGSLNIVSIGTELGRLQDLARAGKLGPGDMSGGTITVSNIGNIGGTYLSPVIVEREVAILGIGRMRAVPAFDDQDRVVKKQVCNLSWSADHRVVDGATMARAAEVVRRVLEEPDVMVMHLR